MRCAVLINCEKDVSQKTFIFSQQQMHITLSAGIAVYPQNGETTDTLLIAADQALYAAKNAGRNRVVMHKDILTTEMDFSQLDKSQWA